MTGNFYFDGVSAEDVGVRSVFIGNAEDTMPVFGGQSPTMQQVITHDHSTFIRAQKDNMRFNMFFTLIDDARGDAFTNERLREIGKFFARSVPVEIMVEEDTTKVIKALPVSNIEVVRFGELRGYFQITFAATIPYWMSAMEVQTFTFGASGGSFSVVNRRNIQDKYGTYDIYPKIVLRNMMATGRFALRNTSPGGRTVEFTNIRGGERIEMHHRIVNANHNQNIFADWNREPFVLVEGQNNLTVSSGCVVDIHMQYPIF